jgi:peptidyl-prolyl cis-trans isomerase D
MFQLFRSRKQTYRIVLAVIVAPIIITMVVTLIPGIFGGTAAIGTDTVLAEVGRDSVTINEASLEFQDYLQQQRIPPQAYGFILPRIVDDLIIEKALLQEAERLGLGVTENELAETLRTSLPALFQGGAFLGKDVYAQFVQERFQKTIPQFEAEFRKELTLLKLRHLVTDNVQVSDQEVMQEFQQRNEKARIDYVTVSAAALQPAISSTAAEVEQHFQQNRAVYTFPERRTFQYLVIDDDAVASKVQVPPQEVERYYNQNRERFRVQERARVTHILLKTTDKSEDEIKAIEARAQDLLKQVRAGKDFAELAKTHSEDPGSAAKGGEVGWITRGQTVPEFEEKAFSMKLGEISEVVKTQYGLHIIKLLEREEARLKPLPEVEEAIREELRRDRLEIEKSRLADAARAAVARHGQNLEAAGKDLGLPVQTASMMERGAPVPGLGAEPGLSDSIFAAPQGSTVGPVVMTARTVIGVVTEVAPARQAELAEVADRVRNDANAAKAREAAERRANELFERAKQGDLRAAARDFRLDVKTSDPFNREGMVADIGSAMSFSSAFTAPVGSVSGPVAAGDNYVVYRVAERTGPPTPPSAEEKEIIRETLLGNRQSEAFQIYREELRSRLEREGNLKVFQDRVDRFVNTRRG